MPPPERIRSAQSSDAAAIAGLLTELGYPATPDAVRRRLDRLLADVQVFVEVAERAGSVMALATLHLVPVLHEDGPRAQLTALVVSETERGRGVGRALVQRIETIAREHGAGRIVVTTANHRAGTHAFYERLDYDWTGRRYGKPLAEGAGG